MAVTLFLPLATKFLTKKCATGMQLFVNRSIMKKKNSKKTICRSFSSGCVIPGINFRWISLKNLEHRMKLKQKDKNREGRKGEKSEGLQSTNCCLPQQQQMSFSGTCATFYNKTWPIWYSFWLWLFYFLNFPNNFDDVFPVWYFNTFPMPAFPTLIC